MGAKEEKAKAGKPAEPSRRASLSALARDVPALTRLALGKRGFAEADLISRWPGIVGPELAALGMPVKLRLPRQPAPDALPGKPVPNRSGGVLTLRASPAASLELQHLKPRILERIATYFGYPAISEIRVEIGDRRRPSKPARTPAPLGSGGSGPDLTAVGDPELRAALERLGAARTRRS